MPVSGVFFVAAVPAHNQFAGNRSQRACSGKQRLQTGRKNPDPSPENLGARDVAEILMSDLMRQNAAQLVVIGTAQ